MLLDNEQVNNEIKKEIKKYMEANENEHTTTQNLEDTVKAVLRGKFKLTTELFISKSQRNNKTLSDTKEGNNQNKSRIK